MPFDTLVWRPHSFILGFLSFEWRGTGRSASSAGLPKMVRRCLVPLKHGVISVVDCHAFKNQSNSRRSVCHSSVSSFHTACGKTESRTPRLSTAAVFNQGVAPLFVYNDIRVHAVASTVFATCVLRVILKRNIHGVLTLLLVCGLRYDLFLERCRKKLNSRSGYWYYFEWDDAFQLLQSTNVLISHNTLWREMSA
jgi:hypothetical protein